MDNKIIEDPFFRLNERSMQWIDKEDWVYQTTFHLTPEMMERQNIELVFKGLDTYADVYLNEKKILEANNMFREWRVVIKPHLEAGENVLKIYFHSPIKVDIPKWDALPYQYEASNDQSENGGVFNKKVSVFARKAGYHYGWDWGPRLVTSGIWRPVYVEAWDDARLNDVFIRQQEVNKNCATILGEIEILADKEIEKANISITEASSGRVLAGQSVSLKKGMNKMSLLFLSGTRNCGGVMVWANNICTISAQTSPSIIVRLILKLRKSACARLRLLTNRIRMERLFM